MTEDQFKQALEQNNAALMQRIETSNAAFIGKLSRHFDTQFEELRTDLAARTDRIYTAVDGLAKRLTEDEQERAAIADEQERQNQWIGQLANATGTTLVPEQ